MAKKKNAPVLRAQGGGGEQPTTTVTKSYAVRDKWLDKAKDNLVEFKSVDGEISDLKVNGEPAGGGGGGGINTARVTINNNLSVNLEIVVPFYFNEDDREIIIGQVITIPRSSSQNPVIALGSTGAIISIITQYNNAACSGETEQDGTDIMVYGDGSVVIS